VPIDDVEAYRHLLPGLEVGQEIAVRVVQTASRDSDMILSLSAAQEEEDWQRAQAMMESGEIWTGRIVGENTGGLLVRFGRLQGFIPAYHVLSQNKRNLSPDQRRSELKKYVNLELPLKVLEVDRIRNRLILSEKQARQQMSQANMERLLAELQEGQVRHGKVRAIFDFGAFVDLGGADGLVHISELSWKPVKHPSEVVQVGDEMDVMVLRLDREQRRISLSLRRLQGDPWEQIEQSFYAGQLVQGTVSHVVDFGAFVTLGTGIEGLVHISEMADPPPAHPRDIVADGQPLTLRVQHVDKAHRRISLSLKRVEEEDKPAP
jgi:small subunit ribosomal protein S1